MKTFKELQEDVKQSVSESSKAYAKTLDKMANDKKLNSISKADKETLARLAKLLNSESVESIDEGINQPVADAVEALTNLAQKLKGRDEKDIRSLITLIRKGDNKVAKGRVKVLSKEVQSKVASIVKPLGLTEKKATVEDVKKRIDVLNKMKLSDLKKASAATGSGEESRTLDKNGAIADILSSEFDRQLIQQYKHKYVK